MVPLTTGVKRIKYEKFVDTHDDFVEKVRIMTRSFTDYSVDFCWWYWYFTATAPLADVPKES